MKRTFASLSKYINKFPVPIITSVKWIDFKRNRLRKKLISSAVNGVHEPHQRLYRDVLNSTIKNIQQDAGINHINDTDQLRFITKLVKSTLDQIMPMNFIVGFQQMTVPLSHLYALQMLSGSHGEMQLKLIALIGEAVSSKLDVWTCPLNPINGKNSTDATRDAVVATLSAGIADTVIDSILEAVRCGICSSVTALGEESGESIGLAISRSAINIARDTRRGAGNVVVASPRICNILATLPGFKLSSSHYAQFSTPRIQLTGTLFNTIQILCDNNQQDDTILVAYKGTTGNVDCGMIYHPWVLLAPYIVVDQPSFEPMLQFITRAGLTMNTTDYHDGSKYFQTIQVTFGEDT